MQKIKEPEGYILVVDDDQIMRDGVADMVLGDKYYTKMAKDGLEAKKILEEDSIVLIITDMKMPEMDGEQLMEQVKEKWPHIPVIVMSAYESRYPRSEALKRGAIAYFEKPFKPKEMLVAVKKVLKQREKI